MRRGFFLDVGLLLGLFLASVYRGGSAKILVAGIGGMGQTQFYMILFLVLQSLLILFLLPHVRRQKQVQQPNPAKH